MKIRRIFFGALAATVVVAIGLVWTVLYTEAGARWALSVATSATDDGLRYESVSGSLAQGVEITDLAYATENVSIVAAGAGFSIDVDLIPIGVTVLSAELDTLEVAISTASDETDPGDPVDTAAILEALSLPIDLTIQDLGVDGISVRLDGDELIALSATELSAFWGDRIEISTLRVESDVLNADLVAGLSLSAPHTVSASVNAVIDPALTRLPEAVALNATLGGDLRQLELRFEETTQGIVAEGRVDDLLGPQPRWDLVAIAPALAPLADQGIELTDLTVSSRGWLDGYRIESTLELVAPERASIGLVGDGSLDGIDLASLTLKHAAGSIEVSGRVDFPASFNGSIRLDEVDPGYFSDAWPPDVRVAARARVEASPDSIVISGGEIEAAGFDGRFDGALDLAAERVSATASWSDLRWPPAGAATIESREGSLVVDGQLDDWAAEASLLLAAPNVAEGRFRLDVRGTSSSADIDIVEGDVLGGSVDGNAVVNWSGSPFWRARIDVDSIVTGTLFPAFPGTVSAAVSAASIDGPAGARLNVESLDGTVLDQPLSGAGIVEVSADRLMANAFRLAHGASRLVLDGDLDSSDGVRFDLATTQLADYSVLVAGDLAASGSLRRQDGQFTVNLSAQSGSLRYDQVAARELAIDIGPSDIATHTLSVRSASVEAAGRTVEAVALDALLGPGEQRVNLSLASLGNSINVELNGAFDDWNEPLESTWRGSLTRFDISVGPDRGGELESPAGVIVSASSASLERFCISGNRGASLCAGLGWARDRELKFDGDAASVPVDLINVFVQTGFDFSQSLSGSVRWLVNARGPTGRVDIRLTEGRVTSETYQGLDLATDTGKLGFEVKEGQLLEGRLDLPLPGTGYVNGLFVLDDVGEGTSSPVSGSLDARIDDIEVIAAFLPDVENAAGQVSADVTLGGTLGAPLFNGRAALTNGALDFFPLGLALRDIELTGQMNDQFGMDLDGSFRAGDGIARISTSRDSAEDDDPGLHFEISGTNLSVVNLPDVTVRADTDLKLDLRGRRVDINGTIDIPYARIRPRNLAATRVDESEDVIIVAGELPDEQTDEKERADLEVFGRLGLNLGDDIEVRLDVARASVTGAAEFEWTGDLVPIGLGRYDVVGTAQAFGQVLNISEGSVRFPNVPADNPGIRIRATREIFGNSQIKRAGILVSGTARRPTIEAYTNPRTTEERALTLLITGNDFDLEQGVGAIDFGTYVAPRLFLSYGVGVFTRDNIVSARYDLTTGWGVRVSSGAKDSGVDMTYRIEN